jgi:dihydrolipoamide dehydrogenase
MSTNYDLIIAGGGPGGYMAAERAGASGKRVLLFEQDTLGGVCLNRGCIPTKSLLHSAKLYHHAADAERFGVRLGKPAYDLARAMAWKGEVVDTLVRGVGALMRRHKVTVVKERARLTGRGQVEAAGETYEAPAIILATGSRPITFDLGSSPGYVLTSDEVLAIERLPERLVIVGGGVIGMEFASYFRLLGVRVTVIELLPQIVANLDADMTEVLAASQEGVEFHLGARVLSAADGRVVFEKDGQQQSVEADMVLLSVGRRPNVEDLGLETVSVEVGRSGVRVDDQMRTNVPGIYAVGDVNGRSLLAHSAYRMAEVAVNTLSGRPDRFRSHAVPWVVYSEPELAGVGLTERQAAEQQREVLVGRFPLRANGRFLAEHGPGAGSCKVIADPGSRVLLGVQIVGGAASEIIHGAAAMIEAELRVQDLREIVFPHPTVSEAVRDALWAKVLD